MSKIVLKGMIDEDWVNYKKPSMYLIFPLCNFKCGRHLCQNAQLINSQNMTIDVEELVQRYLKNPITKAVVCGGMEPLDTFKGLASFIEEFRKYSNDDIVIYSGYNLEEIQTKMSFFNRFPNIIIKLGRYVPEETPYFNEDLGVELVGKNQYTIRSGFKI